MNLELFKSTLAAHNSCQPISNEELINVIKVLRFARELGNAFGVHYQLFTSSITLELITFESYAHHRNLKVD